MHLSNSADTRSKLGQLFSRPKPARDDTRAAATLSQLELRRLVAAMVD